MMSHWPSGGWVVTGEDMLIVGAACAVVLALMVGGFFFWLRPQKKPAPPPADQSESLGAINESVLHERSARRESGGRIPNAQRPNKRRVRYAVRTGS